MENKEGFSVEDFVADNYMKDDFICSLKEVIDSLSATREAVDDLLSAIASYDIMELYDALLDDKLCKILNDDELKNVKTWYDKKFMK